jgi:hypothetical protein
MNERLPQSLESRLRADIRRTIEASPSLRKMYRQHHGWRGRIALGHHSFSNFIASGPFQSAVIGLILGFFSLIAGIVLIQFIGMGVMAALGIPESYGRPVLEWYATLFIPILFTFICAIGDYARISVIGHRHLRHYAALPLADADLFRKAWAENNGHSADFFFTPSTFLAIALGTGLWPAPRPVEGWGLGWLALGFVALWFTAKSIALGFIAPGRRSFRLRITGYISLASIALFLGIVLAPAFRNQLMTLPGRMSPLLAILLIPALANLLAVHRHLRDIQPTYDPEALFSAPSHATPAPAVAPAQTSVAADSDIAVLAIRARLFEKTREPSPNASSTFFSKRWLTKNERDLTGLLRSENDITSWFTWKSIVITLLCGMLLEGISQRYLATQTPESVERLSTGMILLAVFAKLLGFGGFIGISLVPVVQFVQALTLAPTNADRTGSIGLNTLNETYPVTATVIRNTILKEALAHLVVFLPIVASILAFFCLTTQIGRENWFDLAMYALRVLLLAAAFLPFFWTLRVMNMARLNRVFTLPGLAFIGLVLVMPVLCFNALIVPFAFSHLTAFAVTPAIFFMWVGLQRLVAGLFECHDVDLRTK